MDTSILPADVVQRILGYVAADIANLREWRQALPLAGVCMSWRAAAKQTLYTHVYVTNEYTGKGFTHVLDRSAFSRDAALLAACTNMALVLNNNAAGHVRRLVFSTLESRHYLSLIICVIHALPFDGVPDVELLEEVSHLLSQRRRPGNDKTHWSCAAAARVARAVAKRLPNVKELIISSAFANRITLAFHLALVDSYVRQLVMLEYGTPMHFPTPLDTENLRHLDLYVSGDDSGEAPVINPRAIRNIRLSIDSAFIPWEWFHWDRSANTVEFTSLTSLSVEGEATFSATFENLQQLDSSTQLGLSFPNLKDLVIRGVYLAPATLGRMLSQSLRHFSCGGYLHDIQQLCRQDVKSLAKLLIEFDFECYVDDNNSFVAISNEIFQTVQAQQVSLSIYTNGISIDHTRLYWPLLGHLILTPELDFGNALHIFPHCPNVKTATFILRLYNKKSMGEMRDSLAALRQRIPDPSGCQLAEIVFKHPTLKCLDYLCDSSAQLQWYFPELEQWSIDGEKYYA
ncbi:hypothetical protein GGF46_005437 [Coemansia sp. RSA 552]|nr:hypothetical protein GGF46_005437 [Coemansia sp. RSA 552]